MKYLAFFCFFLLPFSLFADYLVVRQGDKEIKIYGKISYKKSYLLVRTLSGVKKIPWKKVVRLFEYPPAPPYPEEEREKWEKIWEKKVKRALLEKKAGLLYQAGLFAETHWLFDKAKWTFQKVLTLDPNHKGARRKLGFVFHKDQWILAEILFLEKWRKLKKPYRKADLLRLIEWCERHRLDFQAESLVRVILRRNNYDPQGIRIFRRLTQRYQPKRRYIFPLKGRYKILVDKTRHHQRKCFAIWAYDIVKVDQRGRMSESRPLENSDFFIWNEPVYAVGDGVVKYVEDKNPDNPLGRVAPFDKVNRILIDHGDGEFSFYCHLRQGSALVKEGEKVKKGQMIARVGNSGASSLPHLHFTLMDRDYFSLPSWWEHLKLLHRGREIYLDSARLQEGWIVESTFSAYFSK